jgi:hypothetical protein
MDTGLEWIQNVVSPQELRWPCSSGYQCCCEKQSKSEKEGVLRLHSGKFGHHFGLTSPYYHFMLMAEKLVAWLSSF